jgi:hypothetical protein
MVDHRRDDAPHVLARIYHGLLWGGARARRTWMRADQAMAAGNDAQQVGPNSGLLSLLGRDQTLRTARLLITGVN